MKRISLLIALSHFGTPFLSLCQSTEDFSDETISGITITTNTGLIISSSNLNWSASTNQLDYNSVSLSPPSPYITPSSNNDFFQITLSDQSKVFSSIEFDLWLNYVGEPGDTGDMGCDCKSYTSENQLIETISKYSNEVAKTFIFNSGFIKKIICNPTNIGVGNNLLVDDINFTIAQQENNNDILLRGTVSAENHQIKNVADPIDAQDVATKNYVDGVGIQGPQGSSAYEIWLNLGNTGTQQDFINSLTGPRGPQGEGVSLGAAINYTQSGEGAYFPPESFGSGWQNLTLREDNYSIQLDPGTYSIGLKSNWGSVSHSGGFSAELAIGLEINDPNGGTVSHYSSTDIYSVSFEDIENKKAVTNGADNLDSTGKFIAQVSGTYNIKVILIYQVNNVSNVSGTLDNYNFVITNMH